MGFRAGFLVVVLSQMPPKDGGKWLLAERKLTSMLKPERKPFTRKTPAKRKRSTCENIPEGSSV